MAYITPEERKARAKAVVENRLSTETKKEYSLPVKMWATYSDYNARLIQGAIDKLEGIADFQMGIQGAMVGLVSKDWQNKIKDAIAVNLTDETVGKVRNKLYGDKSIIEDGSIPAQVIEGIGGMLPSVAVTIGTGGLGAPATVAQGASLATTGIGAAGKATESAFNDGASYAGGLGYGATTGLIEAGTEKLFGGASKALYGKGLLDGIGSSVAKKGIAGYVGKVAGNFAGEAIEEGFSEVLDPLAQGIYKGKVEGFMTPEHIANIKQSALVGGITGAVFGETVGRALAPSTMADTTIQSATEKIDNLNAQENRRFINNTLEQRQSQIDRDRLANYKVIEEVLKKSPNRETLIQRYNLPYDSQGNLNADLATKLQGVQTLTQSKNTQGSGLAYSEKYYSPALRGTDINERLAQQGTRVYSGELTVEENARYDKFKKIHGKLSEKGLVSSDFVISETSDKFNSYIDGKTIVIGKDNFESDKWQDKLVHEVEHFTEGTKEWMEYADFVLNNFDTTQAIQSVLSKGYGVTQADVDTLQESLSKGELTQGQKTLINEVVAMQSESMFGREEAINRLTRSNKTLAQKIYNKIKDFIQVLKSTPEEKYIIKKLQTAEKLFEKALSQAGATVERSNATIDSDTQYSLKDSEGNTLSKEQAEFFKDSKVRDKDGNLMVVYHGTSNDFTVFDISRSDDRRTIFTTSSKDVAKSYAEKYGGGNIMELYANVTNPLIVEGHRRDWNKLAYKVVPEVTMRYEIKQDNYGIYRVYSYDGQITINRASGWHSYEDAATAVEEHKKTARYPSVLNKTRDIAKYAQFIGHDGVIIKDTIDMGARDVKRKISTLAILFDEAQVKNITNKNPTDDPDIRYSLKDSEKKASKKGEYKTNPYYDKVSMGQMNKILADNAKMKVYSKSDAEQIVNEVVSQYLNFGETYGTIRGKSKAEVIDMLWNGLNTSDEGKRGRVALDIADYLINNSLVEETYQDPNNERHAYIIDTLRPYLRNVNLDSIKGDIKSYYDKDNSPYARWGKRKGEKGIGVDQIAMTLEEAGIFLQTDYNSDTPSDLFIEMDRLYRESVEALKKDAKAYLADGMTKDEQKALKQDITRDILNSYDDKGNTSQRAELISKYETRIAQLKEQLADTRERNRVLNKVVYQAGRIKDLKLGTYNNITQSHVDTFNKTIGELGKIKSRGDLNKASTRKYIGDLALWYTADNPFFKVGNVSDYQEDLAERMKEIANGKGQLTTQELFNMSDILAYFKHVMETYNKVKKGERWVDAKEEAKTYIPKIEADKNLRVGILELKTGNMYQETFGDPISVVNRMSRYDETGFYYEMHEGLTQEEIHAKEVEMDILDKIDNDFLKRNKDYEFKAVTRRITFRGQKMTVADATYLYWLLERKQAQAGLAETGIQQFIDNEFVDEAGFAIPLAKSLNEQLNQLKGEEREAFELEMEKKIGSEMKKVQAELMELFTEADKEYIKLNGEVYKKCSEIKKNRDLEKYGVTNVEDGYTVPIFRADRAKEITADIAKYSQDSVRSMSFNKNTVKGAKQRLFLRPLSEVTRNHVRGITTYAYVDAVADRFNKVFNIDTGDNPNDPKSVAKASQNLWKDGYDYINAMIDDIYGVGRDSEGMADFMRRGYAVFQLGLNLKTPVTQLSSLAAASSILSPSSLIKAVSVDNSDVDDFCPLAKLRNRENSAAMAQANLYKSTSTKGGKKLRVLQHNIEKIGDFSMIGIGKVDRLVIKVLWGACQTEIEATQGHKIGTLQNKTAAGELLTKVILRTQQNSLMTQRSKAMRSNKFIQKTATMFSADAMKTVGRVIDGVGEVAVLKAKIKQAEAAELNANGIKNVETRKIEVEKAKELKKSLETKLKKANIKTGKAVGALVSTSVMMAAIAMAFRALYDKEDDEPLETFAVDAFGNLLGGLPMIRDVYGLFTQGYEVNNYAYSTINEVLGSAKDVWNTSAKVIADEATDQDLFKAVKSVLYSGGQLFGLPTRNVYNTVYGLTKRVSPETGYKINSKFYNQSYKKDLQEAIDNEDEDMIATIAGIMTDENIGIKDTKIRKETKSLVEKGFDVLPRSIGDKITYNDEEITLTTSQKKQFKEVYNGAYKEISTLMSSTFYANASDEVKAKAIAFIYSMYYNKAKETILGVQIDSKASLFAKAISIDKLAIAIATANSFTADLDRNGKAINGTKKAKVQKYINSLRMTAAEKYMIMGYLGYKNEKGDTQVKAYIQKQRMTAEQKKTLYAYSGY